MVLPCLSHSVYGQGQRAAQRLSVVRSPANGQRRDTGRQKAGRVGVVEDVRDDEAGPAVYRAPSESHPRRSRRSSVANRRVSSARTSTGLTPSATAWKNGGWHFRVWVIWTVPQAEARPASPKGHIRHTRRGAWRRFRPRHPTQASGWVQKASARSGASSPPFSKTT